jgi:hypothetical protein
MPRQPEPPFLQPGLPAGAGTDRRRIVEQAVLLFLLCEAGEFGEQRMCRGQERFFAVQHGRVFARTIIVIVDFVLAHVQFDARRQGRVGIGLEIGIGQVRNLPREPMQLENVRLFDLSQTSPRAPLVDPQKGIELIQRRAVDVERVGEQLSQRRIAARLVDRRGIAGDPFLPEFSKTVAIGSCRDHDAHEAP